MVELRPGTGTRAGIALYVIHNGCLSCKTLCREAPGGAALQRELLAAVKFYDNNTLDKSIRSRIRKEDRARAKAEKKKKEFEARQMSLFSEV